MVFCAVHAVSNDQESDKHSKHWKKVLLNVLGIIFGAVSATELELHVWRVLFEEWMEEVSNSVIQDVDEEHCSIGFEYIECSILHNDKLVADDKKTEGNDNLESRHEENKECPHTTWSKLKDNSIGEESGSKMPVDVHEHCEA